MRNELFTKEKERQLSLYPRIEKIEVKYAGKSHPGSVFVMNKALSTPYNCAMRKWMDSQTNVVPLVVKVVLPVEVCVVHA